MNLNFNKRIKIIDNKDIFNYYIYKDLLNNLKERICV